MKNSAENKKYTSLLFILIFFAWKLTSVFSNQIFFFAKCLFIVKCRKIDVLSRVSFQGSKQVSYIWTKFHTFFSMAKRLTKNLGYLFYQIFHDIFFIFSNYFSCAVVNFDLLWDIYFKNTMFCFLESPFWMQLYVRSNLDIQLRENRSFIHVLFSLTNKYFPFFYICLLTHKLWH